MLTEAGAADPLSSALVGAIYGGSFGRWPHDEELERKEDHVDPSVRLIWNVTDDTMSYLSYSTGYKSGGFSGVSDAFNQDGSPTDGAEFEDENATAWELGVKTSFWDQRARVSLSDQEGKWEVAAYGRNLTDEATISYTISTPLGAGIYSNGREEPRVLGLQARYNF